MWKEKPCSCPECTERRENKPSAASAGSPLEIFRQEMTNAQKRWAKLAKSFLDLEAYKDAAECAMRADTMKWVIGRIPQER